MLMRHGLSYEAVMSLSYDEKLVLEANAEHEAAVDRIRRQLDLLAQRVVMDKEGAKQVEKQQRKLIKQLNDEQSTFDEVIPG